MPPPCQGGIEFEQLLPPVKHTDAGRREHLVARKRVPVGVERLHIHRHMRDGLRAIDENARAIAVRHLRHLLRGRHGAERVRDFGERDELGARPEQLLIRVETNLPVIVHGHDLQHRARLRAKLLPRHDIGVMLKPGDDDLIVLADVLAAPALRDEVDGLGCAANKHDLVRRGGAKKAADLFARVLIGVGRARRQLVRAAMNVGVLEAVEMHEPVDDGLRLLRGGGVVEPDQRAAVDLLVEDGKVAAHGIDVVARLRRWRAPPRPARQLAFIEEVVVGPRRTGAEAAGRRRNSHRSLFWSGRRWKWGAMRRRAQGRVAPRSSSASAWGVSSRQGRGFSIDRVNASKRLSRHRRRQPRRQKSAQFGLARQGNGRWRAS